MTTKPTHLTGTTARPASSAGDRTPGPDESDPAHTFAMRFTSSPRGARLARRLAALRLDAWGIPHGTRAHDDLTLIVAELTANAVRHGRVPGRDFHLRLSAGPGGRTVRVEVTDTRGERLPRRPPAAVRGQEHAGPEEKGHGLLLVAHLAARWDWHPRPDGPGKTVWAEYAREAGGRSPGHVAQ